MSEFSFVIVTDSHVDVRDNRSDGCWWNRMLTSRSSEILRAAVDEINARRPDFIVHLGDATNASDAPSMRETADILSALDAPVHFVPGNHDTYLADARELAKMLFVGDRDAFYRVERFQDWRLLFLDTVWWQRKNGAITESFSLDDYVDVATPPEELSWLRKQFEEDASTPTLCFTHTVLSTRDSYPVSRMQKGEEVTHRPVSLDSFISSPPSQRGAPGPAVRQRRVLRPRTFSRLPDRGRGASLPDRGACGIPVRNAPGQRIPRADSDRGFRVARVRLRRTLVRGGMGQPLGGRS